MRTELRWIAVASALTSALAVRVAHASCVPGFDYAVFSDGPIHIENHSDTDSYNSATGSYVAGGCGGNIGTNASVTLENNVTVCGTASTAGGGVSATNSATFTTPAVPIPPVTLTPVSIPTISDVATAATWADNATHYVPPGPYTTLGCTGNNTVLQLSPGNYKATTLNLSKCTVEVVSPGAGPVILYVTGTVALSQGVKVNVPSSTGKPTDLVIMYAGNQDVVFSNGGTTLYGGLYAPSATVHIMQQVDVYGAIVAGGSEAHIENFSEVHYDQAMATLNVGAFACPSSEVSRATPIVATISGTTSVVQGSYEVPSGSGTSITSMASIASFSFPFIKGHMRARSAASISTTESSFSSGTILFDAGATGKIPAASSAGCSTVNGTCRNVFTVTSTPDSTGVQFHPALVQLKDSNASTIGPLIASATDVPGITTANYQTIIGKVLSGKLGGVDRSTVAVIEPSTLAGVSTRPTIAYFGATDGMLHAVCASTGGTTPSQSNICLSLGTELWAFLPRTQLPLIRTNTTRLDGSVRVVDAFGDFNDPPSGTKSWRTILIMQTGFASGSGSFAFDITDPAYPVLLWEKTTPASPGTTDVGTGMTVAAGPVLSGNMRRNVAVLQTSNGGTGGTGVVATAVALESGTQIWQFGYLYPSPPRGVAADLPLPTTGIPGGAVGVGLGGGAYLTDFVFGDLYGNFWRLNAVDGASRNGAGNPLFSFTTNRHPIGALPAIYGDGSAQYALFASGGYVDPVSTSWTTANQFLIGVKLSVTTTGLNETASTCATCSLLVSSTLTGSKGYAQILVVGSQLFLTTDSGDVNGAGFGGTGTTGSVTSMNLTSGATTVVAVAAGAGGIANVGTTLYSSSRGKQQQLTSATSTAGASVDISNAVSQASRMLWLRLD